MSRLCFYFMAFPQLRNAMLGVTTSDWCGYHPLRWGHIALLQIISHHNKQVTFLLLLTKLWWYPGMWSVSPGVSDQDVCIIVIITPVTSLLFWISATFQYFDSKYLVTRPQMGRVTKSIFRYKEFISLSKHDNISLLPDRDLARYFIDTFFVTLCPM